ncbi:MAG: hypothetical protein KC431_23555, partial [Myxococcales bacterium]|nr:hypothetical protein [Myxococcales bacterium]
ELRNAFNWPRVPAVILATQSIGGVFEGSTMVEYRIRIEPEGAEPNEAILGRETHFVDMHDYCPGARVTVRVCPLDERLVHDLVLDPNSPPTVSPYPQPPSPSLDSQP